MGGGGQTQDGGVQKPEGLGLHPEGEGQSMVRLVRWILVGWEMANRGRPGRRRNGCNPGEESGGPELKKEQREEKIVDEFGNQFRWAGDGGDPRWLPGWRG